MVGISLFAACFNVICIGSVYCILYFVLIQFMELGGNQKLFWERRLRVLSAWGIANSFQQTIHWMVCFHCLLTFSEGRFAFRSACGGSSPATRAVPFCRCATFPPRRGGIFPHPVASF